MNRCWVRVRKTAQLFLVIYKNFEDLKRFIQINNKFDEVLTILKTLALFFVVQNFSTWKIILNFLLPSFHLLPFAKFLICYENIFLKTFI